MVEEDSSYGGNQELIRRIREQDGLVIVPVFKYFGEYEVSRKYVEDKNGRLFSIDRDFPTENYRKLPKYFQYVEDLSVGVGCPIEFIDIEPYWEEIESLIDGRLTKFVGVAIIALDEGELVEWIHSKDIKDIASEAYVELFSMEDDDLIIQFNDDHTYTEKEFVPKREIEGSGEDFFVYSINEFQFYRQLYTVEEGNVEFVSVEKSVAHTI